MKVGMVSTTPLANSVTVAMIDKFLRVLGEQGVTTGDLRAVIENKQFRVEVAELLCRGPKEPDYPLLGELHFDAGMRLIFNIRGEAFEKSDAGLSRLRDVLNRMDGRDRDILRLYYGLETGQRMSYKQVGEAHGISGTRVREIKSRALVRLRHTGTIGRVIMQGASGEDSIDMLNLSPQALAPLARAKVYTISMLCNMGEGELLALNNFRQKQLDEVKAALQVRDRSLRDS